jgi:hypothetical protein
MKKLFDDPEDDENESLEDSNFTEDDEDLEDLSHKPLYHDKIFSNDYNTGNLDFEEYSNLPKVDTFYAEDNLKECYDSYEYNRKKDLEEKVDLFFIESDIGKAIGNKKKLSKQILPQVYVAIREKFIKNDYTGSEIFTTIAEYFSINYDVLYENIPSVYIEELVRELDEKYGVLKKRGLKRLF